MFTKKGHVDLKKSSVKFLDSKRESAKRLKDLKTLLENSDPLETRKLFDHHYSHIYFVFFDTLCSIEGGFKVKAPKQAKEELDSVLLIFEKILINLPELIRRRWQYHSIKIVMQKLLHPVNNYKVRQDGIRCFLLWFQILGNPVDPELRAMFESLVPLKPYTGNASYGGNLIERTSESSTAFYQDTTIDPGNSRERNFSATSPLVRPVDIEPLVPALPNDPQPQDQTSFYLQSLLNFMVSRVTKINWRDQKETMHFLCFSFLFDQFKEVYVKQLFPDLNLKNSIYENHFTLPQSRIVEETETKAASLIDQEVAANARAVIIRWMTRFVSREADTGSNRSLIGLISQQQLRQPFLPQQSMDSYTGPASISSESREPSPFEYDIVRNTFCSSRENVNLLNEMFRQSFLLPFTHSATMRRVISVYKEWVSRNGIKDLPIFLEEPEKPDSPLEVRVGLQKVIRAFVSNSAHVFVLDIPPDHQNILEEQVDMCKRVLNIYRFMVMKLDMDKETWEQLLLVLLRITSIVIPVKLPPRKEEVLGGRLAPAFFQTLIVTWIRANLHVHISISFWEEFHKTLSQLTEWEELIREWSKTMDTITRVMCRFVYNINLQDLPLDRLNVDRKDRRRRGITRMGSDDTSGTTVAPNTASNALNRHTEGNDRQQHQIPPVNETPNRVPPIRQSTITSHSHEQQQHHHQSHQQQTGRSDWPVAPARRRSSTGIGAAAFKLRHKVVQPIGPRRSNSDSDLFVGIKSKIHRAKSTSKHSGDYQRQKSRSFELLDHVVDDFSDASFITSRSPSPTHSSGRDSTSLRDGEPLNLDGVSLNSNLSETSAKCVVAGGHYRGWAADSAVILWRRMLGVLGDITEFTNPATFALVIDCLQKIVEDLIKVKDNLSISDSISLPPPSLVPPIGYFSPWLIKCVQLSDEYKRGKLTCLKILCQITLRRHETQPNPAFLCQFYNTFQKALSSKDIDVVATILKNSGGKFFSYGLPGATCLLHPLLEASNLLLSFEKRDSDLKSARSEGLSLLGVTVGMMAYFEQIQRINHPVDTSSSRSPDKNGTKDFKDRLLNLILRGVRKDLSIQERCMALNCLGLFVYQELANRSKHVKLQSAISELISAALYKDRVSLRVACENLLLQRHHVLYLLDDHPDIPRRIIEGLNRSLLIFVNQNRHDASIKEIVITVIMCLGEWCMSVPQEFLKAQHYETSTSLLSQIMKTLNSIISEEECLMEESNFDILHQSDNDATLRAQDSARSHSQVHFGNEEPVRDDIASIKLAAKMLLGYLINHLGHFPRPQLRAARLNCEISEFDDNPFAAKSPASGENKEELTLEVLQAPNTLFFILNESSIVSFTEIKCKPCDQQVYHFPQESRVRIIVRDLIGKFVWDCSQIISIEKEDNDVKPVSQGRLMHEQTLDEYDEEDTIRSNERVDMLDSLLHYAGQNGAESLQSSRKRGAGQASGATLTPQGCQAEENMIALLLNQHYQEINFLEQKNEGRDIVSMRNNKNTSFNVASSPSHRNQEESSFFSNCRRLIDQLGFLNWEKRSSVELLSKNDKVLRELRNLDKQYCRETHKIAVIYVAEGQEDKNSILLNSSGSRAFESFVSGLGWEVDLQTHTGFRGGLQWNKSTGTTAPYYATSLLEVIFHVSTRMPASLDENDSMTRKLRHLGNDEIHIIWSDHWRDYRRGIIPTEFGDVLIIIYPVRDSCEYYRISIIRKPEVQFFGPLTDGSVVHVNLLSGLVRATAINASRAQRLNVPFYQNFFEERARSIESIVQKRERTSFEDFAAATYNPASSLGLGSRPTSVLSSSLTSSTTLRDVSSSSGPSGSAFLLDSHSEASSNSMTASSSVRDEDSSPSPRLRNRPISSVFHHHDMSSGNWRVNPRERPLSAAPSPSSPSGPPFH